MADTKREPISAKLRFDVFKRDSFTCQYCGKMSPDVVLEVDHIKPVAVGGDNSILNLITSCFECNRGKGKRVLSSNATLKKQQDQLKELSSKREQMAMMMEWQKELSNFEEDCLVKLDELLLSETDGQLGIWGETKEQARKWIKKYGFELVFESAIKSLDTYLVRHDNSQEKDLEEHYQYEDESCDKAFDYISRICYTTLLDKTKPNLKYINYIIKTLSNRFGDSGKLDTSDYWKVKSILINTLKSEDDFQHIKIISCECPSIYWFLKRMANY